MMSTAFFTHPDCRRHDMGPGHPESPARLAAIEDHFLSTGLADVLVRHDDAAPAR
ncbi:MAG TPA: histone deacetylase family protein, partial [Burkholderiaceae bacterium]|nr:histone deacetylase family protein [Burkholderiaceae bacterium]